MTDYAYRAVVKGQGEDSPFFYDASHPDYEGAATDMAINRRRWAGPNYYDHYIERRPIVEWERVEPRNDTGGTE